MGKVCKENGNRGRGDFSRGGSAKGSLESYKEDNARYSVLQYRGNRGCRSL